MRPFVTERLEIPLGVRLETQMHSVVSLAEPAVDLPPLEIVRLLKTSGGLSFL